ncbi:MAG: transglycosylase domain-containing protein [Bacteroidales bacterium]|nr:transglycosylase domain-containing protein [Bacteroidales bacterium]
MAFKMNKKFVIKLAGIILLLFFLIMVHRMVFAWAVKKTLEHVEHKWGLNVSIGQWERNGLTSATFSQVLLKQPNGDTLFWSDYIHFRIRFFPLLLGKVKLAKLVIDSSFVNLNSSFIKRDTAKIIASSKIQKKPSVISSIRGLFKTIPSTCKINSFVFRYTDSDQWLVVEADSVELERKNLKGIIRLSDANTQRSFYVSGKVLQRQNHFSVTVSSLDTEDKAIPFIEKKWDLALSFNNAQFELKLLNAASLIVNASAQKLAISHPRLAEQSVKFDTSGVSLFISFGKNFWQIDSLSQVNFNGFTFPAYVRYEYDTISPALTFAIPKIEFPAQQFFDALPEGAFKRVWGVKVSGNLAFTLRGRIPFRELDSLYLYSRLQPSDFYIKHFGMANLRMLNDTFTIYRHEPGMEPVAIRVDTTAKSYTHLKDISKYLVYAVLTSEDGSFFYHAGFNEEAFAKSLAENIRKKRFARGASTITMQLVRNVFLSKNKALSRKFEEILLTWMLENSHIVTKERMLEVYFNIIEWGPGIYGVQQAAKFYFNKKPSQLTLQESLFLASIIPSPKYFRYTFISNGAMKDNFLAYFQRVAQIMLARNQISPADTVGLNHKVMLTGVARDYLSSATDSLVNPSDTIFFEPSEDF